MHNYQLQQYSETVFHLSFHVIPHIPHHDEKGSNKTESLFFFFPNTPTRKKKKRLLLLHNTYVLSVDEDEGLLNPSRDKN